MPVTLTSVIIDAGDVETEGAFWHRLLGGSITRTPTLCDSVARFTDVVCVFSCGVGV
ncbi:hypothetical protein [Streptomyces antimycoticus]|uniref:hypothetical protein n=1 Tax=Streptomyces antimycoticus TaxID=68175 RepID=UPI001F30E97A|nr:hypothetical protein [Streptomyces antimycoticus]